MADRKRRVTATDVARAAGVSQSAVSRAFTPGGRIAEATRKRVLEVAAELGYHPNAFARGLVKRETPIVGILMAYVDNHFYATVLERFAHRLGARGRQVMLFVVDDDTPLEQTVRTALQYQLEAVVIASITLSSRMARTFTAAGVPVILFNRYAPEAAVSAVVCDNVAGGRAVADLLLDAGHRRIAFVGGVADSSTNREREEGFRARLDERGVAPTTTLDGAYSYEWGREAATRLLAVAEPPDALFCANDVIALGALDALRHDLGLDVPDDVAVVGFDDIPAASWEAYRLTTVRQPLEAMIERTLALLIPADGEERPDPSPGAAVERLSGELIVRGTTR